MEPQNDPDDPTEQRNPTEQGDPTDEGDPTDQVNPTDTGSRATTRKHLRGSSLMLAGRLFALGTNFLVQILIVRYLTKADYGAFAYALSVAAMGTNLVLLGMQKAVPRFVPIQHERGDYHSMFGTIVLALGNSLGLGIVFALTIFGFKGILFEGVDPVSVELVLIVVALAPSAAWDALFQGLLATFASPRAIFLRRHVLGPGLRLAAVATVMACAGSVYFLAWAYLVAGILGVLLYVVMIGQVFHRRGLWAEFRGLRVPFRQIYSFSLPLLSSDAVLIFKTTMAVIVLEATRGAADVAEFRAVVPVAGLNLIVLQSLKLLYTPTASRLFARGEDRGIHDLYWQSALWITVVTLPVFLVCFLLGEEVSTLLFGSRYEGAGVLLATLAVGNYFNAALGLNAYTLQIYARVRLIVCINTIVVVVAVAANLLLIPRFGALGAALATTSTVILHNLLNHLALAWRTPVELVAWRYLGVYGAVTVVVLALWGIQPWLPPALMILLAALATLLLLRVFREVLDLAHVFPEIARVPGLRFLLGVTGGDH